LDGLRALAISLVILNHLEVPGFSGGFIGVDVFFVISGYLITSILAEDYLSSSYRSGDHKSRYVNLRVFYFKRARRILPVAFTVIFLTLILTYIIYPTGKFMQELSSAVWSSLFFANEHLISNSTNYFMADLAQKSAFQHYWSLAVEEQFYLVYPFLFLIVSRLHGLRSGKLRLYWYRRLALILIVVWILSFAYNLVGITSSPIEIYFSTISRIWELASGCLLALLRYSKVPTASPKRIKVFRYSGLIGIFCCSFFLSSTSQFPGFVALIPVFGTCLLIYSSIYSVANESRIISIFSLPLIRYIGKLSYSMYLIHWPLLLLIDYKLPTLLDNPFGKLIYIAMLLFFSVLSFTLIEKPTRKIPVPDSLYLEREGLFKRALNYLIPRVSGDLLFIGLVSVVILTILLFVRGYTPTTPSSIEFKPFVYPQFNQSEDSNSTPGSANTQNLDSIRIAWQKKMSDDKMSQSINPTTEPSLSLLMTDSGNKIPWGWSFTTIQNSCRVLNSLGGLDTYLCKYRNQVEGATIKVLLVGDSHAQQMVPTVVGAFSKQNLDLTVLVRSGCQIGGLVSEKPTAADLACTELWKTGFKSQFANQSFDYAIASDWGKPMDNGETIKLRGQALTFLKSISLNLVLLAPTPIYPIFQSCLEGESNVAQCDGKRTPSLDARYASLAASSGARFFSINDYLCLDTWCPAIIRNKFVNRGDGSHLTASIAKELVEPFKAFLEIA
jgi:peptidoglycan/LPS O-acetylase OafA/YrhL